MKKKEYKQENQELKQRIADLELELTACYQVATERTQRIAELEKEIDNLKEQGRRFLTRYDDLQKRLAKSQIKHKKATSWATEFKNDYMIFRDMALKLEQDNSELNNLHFQYQNENNSLEIENAELKNELEKQKLTIDRFNKQLSQECRSRINSHNERVRLRTEIANLQKELEKQKNHNPFYSIDIDHDLQSIIIRKLNEYRYYNIIDGSVGTAQRQSELRNEVVGLRNENSELKKELEEYKKDKEFWDKYSKISINELQGQEPKPRDVKEIMEYIDDLTSSKLYIHIPTKNGDNVIKIERYYHEINCVEIKNNFFHIQMDSEYSKPIPNVSKIIIGENIFKIEDFI